MTGPDTSNRAVVKERNLKHSAEKVWRALTQQHLIEDWTMENDFRPEVGHRFEFNADWGKVTGEVLAVQPEKSLSYTWKGPGLDSIVTWTLTETDSGTHLCMEQTGFGPEHEQAYRGATSGWTRFLYRFEQVVADLD